MTGSRHQPLAAPPVRLRSLATGYFRLRNSVEGINGFAKDRLQERLEDADTLRIRGIAAQTLLLAFQLAHANRRKLASWADAIALGGERPRRRPPAVAGPSRWAHGPPRATSPSAETFLTERAPRAAQARHTKRTRTADGPQPPTVRFTVPRDRHHTAETGMGGIAIAMPPIPSVQLEHFRRCSRVREGGVEPPRPCGHWNLNPARLPIPPPAHWVCPRALPLRSGAFRHPEH